MNITRQHALVPGVAAAGYIRSCDQIVGHFRHTLVVFHVVFELQRQIFENTQPLIVYLGGRIYIVEIKTLYIRLQIGAYICVGLMGEAVMIGEVTKLVLLG